MGSFMMESPQKNEVLLKDGDDWLHFTDPHSILVADKLEDVSGALTQVDEQVQTGGWHAAGFLSYEAAPAFEPAVPSRKVTGFPYLWFGLYPEPKSVKIPASLFPLKKLDWTPTVDRDTYTSAVDKVREYIANGRTYQVNYTMRLQSDYDASAWDLFVHLAQYQNRYAAYVNTGRYIICSASPELFFQLDGTTITCRPMKGTVRRGRTTGEDLLQSDWLRNSKKNRAENIMIVDMIRNDLGRIARIGTVHVPELFTIERYPTLWQMTSTIRAQTSASLPEIIRALFPCASITGAPKISTMKIIHELETSPRNIYTGIVGHIAPGRKATFNVAIRTALIDREMKKAEYGIGGGIIWDSSSADEYEEALLKARVLTEPYPAFSLFETMLWTPDEGIFLKESHLTRLLDSATYFGFPISELQVRETLDRFSPLGREPRKVRLVLDHQGIVDIQSTAIAPEGKTLHAHLANQPVQTNETFLYHKTTRRDVYDHVRSAFTDYDDVLLYNERDELTEFTIGNLVVELDRQLFTPPVECGLLPGTFRTHLVETGQVLERIVPVEQLKDCTKIFRVNSVRKWELVRIEFM
jgi:para-aminobenzoate synthetase / 4-amino-4-deoxychorismate lyase